MRVSARILTGFVIFIYAFFLFGLQAHAQTTNQPSVVPYTNTNSYLTPNADPNVPINHHSYTQIALIDVLSAVMCQLTGIDPTNPQQPCLGVNVATGKIGLAPTAPSPVFGQAQPAEPQVGGAIGTMTQFVTLLYIPAVSSTQYVQYLSDNFGLVKPTYAAGTDCNKSRFGYGFCGLSPLLTLWSDVRDLSYAMLTILFVAIGIGVMLRFRVDPRTVMTLQNQIPRVIIAILLITFSFAIAGAMIDLMWTVTYAGVSFISNSAPNSKIALCPAKPKPINQVADTRLLDQPISFTNTVFRADCNGNIDNGLLSLSDKVSASLGDLVTQVVHDILFGGGNTCHPSFWQSVLSLGTANIACALQNGALNIILWITEQLVKLIIIICILIALFRLWFQLIKAYLTFLIFVILGPVWIVLGLIPGRPMGFEKWLRIVFANLAVFPLVAFILVFARVLTDAIPTGPATPNTVFVPPLIGNPNLSTFSALMGFGAIMIAPTIPDLIKERMKATGQSKMGSAVAAGIGMGAAAFAAPGRKTWESLNRRNPQTGEAEGPLAVRRQQLIEKLPIGIGRRVKAARLTRRLGMSQPGDKDFNPIRHQKELRQQMKIDSLVEKGKGDKATRLGTRYQARETARERRWEQGPLWRRVIGSPRPRTRPPEPRNPSGSTGRSNGNGGTGEGDGPTGTT